LIAKHEVRLAVAEQ